MRTEWALALFRRSVLKQQKYAQIVSLLGELDGKACLDVGADNGVISLLLRQRGGSWQSADADARTVEAIRELVGGEVQQLRNGRMPYADACFDVVVIVDYLEHVQDDRTVAAELKRVLKPRGTLIVNVPHLKPRSRLNRLRHRLGLTDERHGHVRPGYTLEQLRELLGADLELLESRTYSGTFSELVDTLMNLVYERGGRRQAGGSRSAKGPVVTRDDYHGRRLQFMALSAAYPLLWLMARLDRLLFLQQGYKLILKARRNA